MILIQMSIVLQGERGLCERQSSFFCFVSYAESPVSAGFNSILEGLTTNETARMNEYSAINTGCLGHLIIPETSPCFR